MSLSTSTFRLCVALSFALLRMPVSQAAPSQKAKSQGAKKTTSSKVSPPARSFALQVGKPVETQIAQTAQKGSFKVQVLHPAAGRLIGSLIQRPTDDASFLTLHTFSIGDVGASQRIFPFQGKGVISGRARDPQWSPDGRYVLFKYGNVADIRDTFSLYVWDTQTNALQLVSSRYISYLQVSWSPDSNYIAFVVNGDIFGRATFPIANSEDYIGPLQLFVCNWRTGKECLVTSNDTLHGPFTWLAPHSLLYDIVSHHKQELLRAQRIQQWKKDHTGSKSPVPLQARPDIYKYSVEENRSHLLIPNGTRAVPSPDGQHIAFFGPEKQGTPLVSEGDWRGQINGDSLCVARNDGTARVPLNREHGFYPSITWMPDNQHLVSLQQTKPSPTAEAEVKQWDTKEGTFRLICVLRVCIQSRSD